ncbi:hypothetical protein [Nocardiopsis sp. JB363]|uniref:hypothetical protein n=1 Tax=Nocardiopsis sp. JB363 TaxID=1434837 RepID=UPI00097A1119|nr:hypothetical protein [Nocardiopsis sp. JB363]SIO87158.1 hypothetical protein BQ8420_15230 [Nocardiopsis sp. JB363]
MDPNDTARARPVSVWEWVLRVAVLAAVAVLLWEFVTAGQLITDNLDALPLHYGGALAVHVTTGAQLLAAGVLWFSRGRGPGTTRTVFLLSLGAFVVGFPQAALGTYGPLQAHVPLALLLVTLVVWSAVLIFRRRPA